MNLPYDLKNAAEKHEAFLVGGSVRDHLLEKIPDDYDIVVLKNPEKFAASLARQTKGHLVKLGKKDMMIFRVIAGNKIYDISPPKGFSLKDDLIRRDFTINALATDLSSGNLTDYTGGLMDMQDKIVRMVSESSFTDDPLRLLRAFRMAASLNFTIETKTLEAVRKYAPLICRSAGERIRAELMKIFYASDSYPFVCKMAETELLYEVFPELTALKGCIQNRHHDYDVLNHTMSAFFHLETILKNTEISRENAALLKMAVLLHDIGKPSCRTTDKNGEVHFYGHEQKSADMTVSVAQRLKFSRTEAGFLDFIIRNHLRPLLLFREKRKNTITDKAITRFFMKCGEFTPFLLFHVIADHQGKGKNRNDDDFTEFITEITEMFHKKFKPKSSEPPLITGNDLISEFGLAPSPLFKKILIMIEEERLSGNLKNREDALKWIYSKHSDMLG